MLIIYAGTNGYLDAVAVADAPAYETELFRFFDARHQAILAELRDKKIMSDELKAKIDAALKEFNAQFLAARKAA